MRAARLRVELGPSDTECHSMLVPSLVFADRPAEALPHTRLVLERDPLPPGYVLSGVDLVFWANGRNDEAIEALDRCLEQSPLFILCRINRVVSLVEAGRLDAARGGAASRLAGSARGRCKALRRRRRDRAATRPARAPGSCA